MGANFQLLKVGEAAEALNASPATVYRLIARKEISVVRVGRSVRIHPADLAKAVQKMTLKSIYDPV